MCEISKIARQKITVFLYTSNRQLVRKESLPQLTQMIKEKKIDKVDFKLKI